MGRRAWTGRDYWKDLGGVPRPPKDQMGRKAQTGNDYWKDLGGRECLDPPGPDSKKSPDWEGLLEGPGREDPEPPRTRWEGGPRLGRTTGRIWEGGPGLHQRTRWEGGLRLGRTTGRTWKGGPGHPHDQMRRRPGLVRTTRMTWEEGPRPPPQRTRWEGGP